MATKSTARLTKTERLQTERALRAVRGVLRARGFTSPLTMQTVEEVMSEDSLVASRGGPAIAAFADFDAMPYLKSRAAWNYLKRLVAGHE